MFDIKINLIILKFIYNYKKQKNLTYVFYNTTGMTYHKPNFREKAI